VLSSRARSSTPERQKIKLDQIAMLVLDRSPLGALVRWVARIRASVHAKLLGAFLIVTLLFIAMALVSLQTLVGTTRQSQLIDQAHERVSWAQQIDHALARQMDFTGLALLSQDEAAIANILRENNRFNSMLAKLEAEGTAEQQGLIEQIRSSQDDAMDIVADMANAIRAGKLGDVTGALRNRQVRVDDEITQRVGRLVEAEQRRMAQLRDGVNAANRRTLALTAIFAVSAVLLALLCGFVISWSFILPVRGAQAFLGQVAAGNFGRSISVPNRDEFGALADSLNHMSQELHRIDEERRRAAGELGRLNEQLTRTVGQLTALGEVGQAISSTLDLETVLKTVVSRAIELTGLDAGAIYEFDAASGHFALRAFENFDEESVAGLRSESPRAGEGAVGASVAAREPRQVPDTHAPDYPARLRDLLDREGFRAILAVPLLRENQIIGALMVLRRTAGPFAPEVVELLNTFSVQSALAIQNARLFREIAEKGKQLEVASRHKSQFLASMSHELRTPLNAILGFNEMIIDEVYGEVPADVKTPLENIQTSGKHLLRLINNVLDLAKIEAGRMELSLADYLVHDTVGSVYATLRPLAEEKGLEFVTTLPDDLPLAFGDSGRIAQCVMNLAGNSLKFTKAGKVEISVDARDGILVFRVSDTGIGIPPEKIDSLFTEFKQTDASIASEYGGTGLGLSISRKFVEMHGGRIWAESEQGKGSVFIFEIPLRVSEGART
jgi:signal transduction histidine kinase/HAMP domain-containing protein